MTPGATMPLWGAKWHLYATEALAQTLALINRPAQAVTGV